MNSHEFINAEVASSSENEDGDQIPLMPVNNGELVIDVLSDGNEEEVTEEVDHNNTGNHSATVLPTLGPMVALPAFAVEPPPDAKKRTFTVTLAISFLFMYLIGCIVVGVTAVNDPEAIIIGGILSLVPTFVLIHLFYWRKHREKASLHLFSKLFLFAFFGALPAAFIEVIVEIIGLVIVSALYPIFGVFSVILFSLFNAFVVAAGVEESLKYILSSRMTFQQKSSIWHPKSCLIYGLAVSLGFATLENILYVLLETVVSKDANSLGFSTTTNTVVIAILRGLLAVPMHAVCGLWIGHGFFRRIYKGEKLPFWTIMKAPVLIHGLYDACLMVAVPLGITAVVIGGVLAIFVLIYSFRYFMRQIWPQSEENCGIVLGPGTWTISPSIAMGPSVHPTAVILPSQTESINLNTMSV